MCSTKKAIIFKNYENKEDYCEAKLQDSTFRKFKS